MWIFRSREFRAEFELEKILHKHCATIITCTFPLGAMCGIIVASYRKFSALSRYAGVRSLSNQSLAQRNANPIIGRSYPLPSLLLRRYLRSQSKVATWTQRKNHHLISPLNPIAIKTTEFHRFSCRHAHQQRPTTIPSRPQEMFIRRPECCHTFVVVLLCQFRLTRNTSADEKSADVVSTTQMR